MNNKENNKTNTDTKVNNNNIKADILNNNHIKSEGGEPPHPNKTLPQKKTVKTLSDRDREVIDQLYANGFNMAKAYRDATKNNDMYTSTATNLTKAILKKPEARAYLEELKEEQNHRTHTSREQLVTELKAWLYADATDIIELTPEEVKKLPPDTRRAIQGYKMTTKKVKGRDGNDTTITTVDCKLVSKTDAIEKLIKMNGLYLLDNQQKTLDFDLTKLSIEEQKAAYQLGMILNKAQKQR